MILAAGFGSRLRPLTDHTPKAMLKVGGAPILDHVAKRLIAAGADRLIINVHHLGDQIERHVRERNGYGVETIISREEERALETGGGVLHAADHFRRESPFLLYNADILTDLSLPDLLAAHDASGALATLAVMARPSSRQLLFDDQGLLGRTDERRGLRLEARPARGEVTPLGFAGIHAISPEFLDLISERGAFSILDVYLRLVREGHPVLPYRIDGVPWLDIGKPEHLADADAWLERSLPPSR